MYNKFWLDFMIHVYYLLYLSFVQEIGNIVIWKPFITNMNKSQVIEMREPLRGLKKGYIRTMHAR